MSLARRAAVVATTLALGGCIVLIDPIEAGDHCGIQGEGECAQCIRKNCESPIDRCCANESCLESRMLAGIDACGRGDTAPCVDILNAGRTAKEEEDVRKCVQTSCKAVCTQGSGGSTSERPKWTCSTSRDTDTDCALCVYTECASLIEVCCTDSSCANDSSLQTDMAACVAGDAPGCAYMASGERGTTGQAGILRRCIETECSSRCLGDGLPHADCELYSSGEYCRCIDAQVADGPTCRAATIGEDARCVRGEKGCTCGSYACVTTSFGCSCAFHGGSGTSCNKPTPEGTCCVRQDEYGITCACEEYSSCTASLGESEIASCNLANVLAWAGGAVVDSCSR